MTEKNMHKYAFRKTALSLALLFLFSLAASAFNACFRLSESESYERVDLQAKLFGSDSLMQIGDLELLETEFQGGTISFSSQVPSHLINGIQTFPVTVTLTDSDYPLFSQWTLTSGTFITEEAYQWGRNVAVISETLASKLFMSLNVIGNSIQIFDKEYTIIGLYKPPDSLVTLLGSDGLEQVYVPLSSHQEMSELPLKTVLIQSSSLAKEHFKESTLEDILVKKLHLDVGAYQIVIYDKMPVMLSQFQDILLFCLGLGLALEMIKLLIRFWKRSASFVKINLENMYWRDFLRHHFFLCLRFFVISLVGIALVIFVLRFIEPRLWVPSRYLPQENIFDLEFYTNELKTAIQSHNASYEYQPTALESSFSNLLIINLILMSLSLPALISLTRGIKLNQYLRVGLSTYIRIGMTALLIAASGHMLLVIWGVYEWVLPLKTFLILPAFYIIKSMVNKN